MTYIRPLPNPDSVRNRRRVYCRPTPEVRKWLLAQMVESGTSLNAVIERILIEARDRHEAGRP